MEKRNYFGYFIKQRTAKSTIPFFVFYARAKDIKQWSRVVRVVDTPQGTQRLLKEPRKRAITRFLSSEAINTIPTNVLLAFESNQVQFNNLSSKLSAALPNFNIFNNCEGQLEWGELTFSFDPTQPDYTPPALVIDGQHRINGIVNFEDEDLPILVVCLLDAPPQEQAFQFVVINNKAVKVPTDNVKAIIANLGSEEALQERLLKAGVRYGNNSLRLKDIDTSPSSPFQNTLKWPNNRHGEQLVSLATIEQALKYIQTTFAFLDDDEPYVVTVFCTIWSIVKASNPELWGKDNNLMKKVSIKAFNEFIIHHLKYAWQMGLLDLFNLKDIEKHITNIVKLIPQEYWAQEWSNHIKIQDNINSRTLIKKDLDRLVENKRLRRTWYKDLVLPVIDKS